MDIYKCPIFKSGGQELKFSYIIVFGVLGGFGIFFFYYKYFETTRLTILKQRRYAGLYVGLSIFIIVTMDGLMNGE
jgi:hypothetical protein